MKLFRLLFLLVINLAFNQGLHASSDNNDIFYEVLKKGEIRIGVSILPPWVMKNKEGKFTSNG